MPAWPASLPQFVQEAGYSEQLPDLTVESAMDSGPAKIRRRWTARSRMFRVQIACTPVQATAFEAFFETDCAGGAVSFTWVHPRTRAARTFRFRKPTPSARTQGEQVIYSLSLEQMP